MKDMVFQKQKRFQEAKEAYQVAATKDKESELVAMMALVVLDLEMRQAGEESQTLTPADSSGEDPVEQFLRTMLTMDDVKESELTPPAQRFNQILKETGLKYRCL